MLQQKNSPERKSLRFTWGTIGYGIMFLPFLVSFLTGYKNYIIAWICIALGVCLTGWDAYQKGELKKFLWFHVLYILIFAILVYFQLKSTL